MNSETTGSSYPRSFIQTKICQLREIEAQLNAISNEMSLIIGKDLSCCDHCGRETFRNRDDRQLQERTLAAAERVKKLANFFGKKLSD